MILESRNVTRAGLGDRRRPGVLQIAAITLLLLIALGFFVHRYVILNDHPLFWDMRVYFGAIKAHALGIAPYQPGILEMLGIGSEFKYTSTPLVDHLFSLASRYPGILTGAEPVFIVIHLASIVSIIVVMTSLFLGFGSKEVLLGVAIYLLLFSTAGLNSLAAANNGTLLYGLIGLAAYKGLTERRWATFHVVLTIAVAVKPIYAPLWILPVFADRVSVRQIGYAIAGGSVAVASYLIYVAFDPATVHDWIANLQSQSVQTANDLGDNVFAAVYDTDLGRTNVALPLVAQCTYDVAMVTVFWLGDFKGRSRWAALIVIAIFANPRLMAYDSAVGAIPLVALAADALPLPGTLLTRAVLVSVPSILASIILPYRTIHLVPDAILQPALALAVLSLAALKPSGRAGATVRAAA